MEHEQVEVRSRAALRQWLSENHQRSGSIWLITWKKHTDHHVSWDDVVEEALCFGWIDSQPRKLDQDRSMIRLSPRKPGSGWSGVNKARIEGLLAEGLVAPPGIAAIESARRDGSWTALDGASRLSVPDDLVTALDAHPGAAEHFDAFPPSARRSILEWIATAKRTGTRAERVNETARLAQLGQRANQWSKR
ncbi:YdeI family protein [Brevundimonas sp.]|uniref:YdeI/OmpD-associated family protein n=1 Tax=Brevundimonas sp. TaxID=1871086 RepID=UPI00263108B9|nr:YdeI/OmpD-associated family protein [Brevundimonas sp.]